MDSNRSQSSKGMSRSASGSAPTPPSFIVTLKNLYSRRVANRKDSSNAANAPNHVELLELREQCNAAEDLGNTLESAGLRGALYEVLLLCGRRDSTPPSFTPYRSTAAASDSSFAGQLHRTLAGAGHEELTEADGHEVLGFIGYFSSKTGLAFDVPLRGLAMALAHAIATGTVQQPTFASRVQLLFGLLYHLQQTACPSSGAAVFAHSFEELFRLLLQYHDPLLCAHLDQRVVNIGSFALSWVRSLFCDCLGADGSDDDGSAPPTAADQFSDVLALLDWVLVGDDRLLPVFLSITLLIEQRNAILAIPHREKLETFFTQFTFRPQPGTPPRSPSSSAPVIPLATVLPPCLTVKDVVKKARIAMKNTPTTSRHGITRVLFPTPEDMQVPPSDVRGYYLSFVALPVESDELATVFAPPPLPSEERGYRPAHLNYIILDCRSASSFEFARLPTALHVGDEIGFDAELLEKMVQRFETAKGSHLCVLGTGRTLVEEANLLKMIALHLTQHGFPYVSIAVGGFKACIPRIKEGKMEYIKTPGRTKRKNAGDEVLPSSRMGCLPPAASSTVPADTPPQAAGGWGWGFMRSVAEKVESLAHNAKQVGAQHINNNNNNAQASTTIAPQVEQQAPLATSSDTKKTPPAVERKANAHSEADIFSLGDEGEDDLELITVVPPAKVSAPPPPPATTAAAVKVVPLTKDDEVPTTNKNTNSAAAVSEGGASPQPKQPAASVWDDDEMFNTQPTTAATASQSATKAAAVPSPSTAGSQPRAATSEPHPFDDIFV